MTEPRSLSGGEIQRDLLDSGTVLLEYWLGVDRSFVWEVTKDSLRSYELPKRATLEASAREAYARLSAAGETDGKTIAAVSRRRLEPAPARLVLKPLVIV